MTEKRIKELAAETAKDILEDAFRDLNYLANRFAMFGHVVAAEAREEGIEERNNLRIAAVAATEMLRVIEETDYDSGGYDSGPNNDDLNRWHNAIGVIAEYLMEQGK